MSVKFLSAILGPEMAAPILWAPGKNAVLSAGETHVHKIPPFRGGGECGFYFYGRGDFSEHPRSFFSRIGVVPAPEKNTPCFLEDPNLLKLRSLDSSGPFT